jgi:hypothetical protein
MLKGKKRVRARKKVKTVIITGIDLIIDLEGLPLANGGFYSSKNKRRRI